MSTKNIAIMIFILNTFRVGETIPPNAAILMPEKTLMNY